MAQQVKQSDLSIFVGGLINSTTNTELFAYFSQFGTIIHCEAQMWKNNPGKCRGFAVLTTGDQETYEAIMGCPHVLGGRHVECKPLVKDRSQLSSYCKDELHKKLYISSISKKVTDEQLGTYFAQFGEVKIAYIVRHHKDNKPKGFGFVCFATKEGKAAALGHQVHSLLGKQVFCTEYSTKADLKKGTKTNNYPDQEEYYQTSENYSDQETQENHGSQLEEAGFSAEGNAEYQTYYDDHNNEGHFNQGWEEGYQQPGINSHSDLNDHYYQEENQVWQEEEPEYEVYSEVCTQTLFYTPFGGSNTSSLLQKLAQNRKHSNSYNNRVESGCC